MLRYMLSGEHIQVHKADDAMGVSGRLFLSGMVIFVGFVIDFLCSLCEVGEKYDEKNGVYFENYRAL